VKPWELLGETRTPEGEQLTLTRHGTEYVILASGQTLMSSRMHGSEEALAAFGCARARTLEAPCCLVGGLGMGFTLRAALSALPADASVTVAELVPAVVQWARGPMLAVFQGCLDDPRLAIHQGDVGELIRQSKAKFDAILLDVDNGPDGLTRRSNDSLYDFAGLRSARDALRPGGVLAVWSSGPDAGFTRRLRDCGFAVEAVNTRANGKRGGARHVIWLAVK